MQKNRLLLFMVILFTFQSPLYCESTHITQLEEFRTLFFQNLTDDQKLHINEYSYLAPSSLLEVPPLLDGEKASSWIARLEEQILTKTPYQFYEAGRFKKESDIFDLQKIYQNWNEPITIIIIPGIFGEFIDDLPFPETFDQNQKEKSHFYQLWKDRFKALPENSPLRYDLQKSLANTPYPQRNINSIDKPLDELVNISGVPHPFLPGQDIIQIIGLKLPTFSLESLGDQYAMSDVYLHRLDKIFKILPEAQSNIALVGYSRGGPIVLDLIAKAHHQNTPPHWLPHIKAAIMLGGVVYGTEIADFTVGLKKPLSESLKDIQTEYLITKKLGDELEYMDGNSLTQSMVIFHKNLYRYLVFAKDLLILLSHKEGQEFSLGDLFNSWSSNTPLLMAFTKLNPYFPLHRLGDFAFNTLKVDSFFSEYNNNIHKFKLFVEEVSKAIYQLSTADRIEWWQKNQLPNKGIRYYAITGTLVDPSLDPSNPPLIENPYCFAPQTFDHQFLVSAYHNFAQETRFVANDSQMTLVRSQFWDQYNTLLNPYYKEHPIKSSLLTILGTHHWGFALREAFMMQDKGKNPFPRLTLFKTLAMAIHLDLHKEKN